MNLKGFPLFTPNAKYNVSISLSIVHKENQILIWQVLVPLAHLRLQTKFCFEEKRSVIHVQKPDSFLMTIKLPCNYVIVFNYSLLDKDIILLEKTALKFSDAGSSKLAWKTLFYKNATIYATSLKQTIPASLNWVS